MLPPLAGAVASGDAEMGVKDFAELQTQGFMGLNPENVGQAVAALGKLLR